MVEQLNLQKPMSEALATPPPANTGIQLPTSPIPATVQNPKNLVIFAKPKTGKTTLLAALPNCLILDLEEGSDYVSGLKIKALNLYDVSRIGQAILAANKPYKYVAIDTITALEDMCIPRAEELYSKTLPGKNWFTDGKLKYKSILNLPNGSGYPWLKEAFNEVVKYISTWAPHVILVGHLKDTMMEKNGAEFSSSELDLTGKIKRTTAAKSDAIGYLYRKGNNNILSFKTSDEIACGARPAHLKNKEIVVSESIVKPDGTEEMVFHWDQIYVQ